MPLEITQKLIPKKETCWPNKKTRALTLELAGEQKLERQ